MELPDLESTELAPAETSESAEVLTPEGLEHVTEQLVETIEHGEALAGPLEQIARQISGEVIERLDAVTELANNLVETLNGVELDGALGEIRDLATEVLGALAEGAGELAENPELIAALVKGLFLVALAVERPDLLVQVLEREPNLVRDVLAAFE